MWSFFVRVIARGRARVERCRLSRRAPVADLILTRRRVRRRTRSDAPRDADAAGGRAVHASARVQQPEAREREGHDHGEPHAMRSRAREVSGARGRVTFVNSKFAKSARKRFISSKDFLSQDCRPAYVNAEQHESSIDNLLLFSPPPFRLRLLRLLRRLPPRAPARGFLLLPVRAELLRRGRAFPLFPAAAAAELVVVGDVVHPPDRRRGHVPGRGASSLVLIVVVTVHAEVPF